MEGGQGEFDRPQQQSDRAERERSARRREREAQEPRAPETPRRRSLATPTSHRPPEERPADPAPTGQGEAAPRRAAATVRRRAPEPPRKVPVASRSEPAPEAERGEAQRPRRMRPGERERAEDARHAEPAAAPAEVSRGRRGVLPERGAEQGTVPRRSPERAPARQTGEPARRDAVAQEPSAPRRPVRDANSAPQARPAARPETAPPARPPAREAYDAPRSRRTEDEGGQNGRRGPAPEAAPVRDPRRADREAPRSAANTPHPGLDRRRDAQRAGSEGRPAPEARAESVSAARERVEPVPAARDTADMARREEPRAARRSREALPRGAAEGNAEAPPAGEARAAGPSRRSREERARRDRSGETVEDAGRAGARISDDDIGAAPRREADGAGQRREADDAASRHGADDAELRHGREDAAPPDGMEETAPSQGTDGVEPRRGAAGAAQRRAEGGERLAAESRRAAAPPPPRGVILETAGEVEAIHGPIVAPDTVAGRGLTVVIAIMTFLCALLLGGAILVHRAADAWSVSVLDEVSVSVLPLDGDDIDSRLQRVAEILASTDGLSEVTVLPLDQSEALLEPWLGEGMDLSILPVPRLVVAARSGPVAASLSDAVAEIPGASLDDHSAWSERLSGMAATAAWGTIGALGLMLVATAISIVFATRSALAMNAATIAVLHVLGAEDRFIARAFRRRFLKIGFRGAAIGLAAALVLFGALELGDLVVGHAGGSPQAAALLGDPSIGLFGYIALAGVGLGVVLLVTLTSNWSVRRHLNHLSF
ncbi:hypothetical protein L1787_05045 [Acuticoccus sp. M5D2P5]|uniref:hypothetical protein n=1 Tax=Acuticoccus kalidii TaxID=2910977 RepID=UPI001F281190|nr:hypothetical protein [Acuticoccus kalidii]MCF3932781.1 hypothetical protein [Acuticoccus kalidii]